MITVTSNINQVVGLWTAGMTAIPAALDAGVAVAAEGVRGIVVPAIRDRTPRRSGRLGESTEAEIVQTGEGADVVLGQPATSARNLDGSGGGFPYAVAVLKGRKAITAPSDGAWSTGKKGLRTPFGVRKSVKAAPGHDYITPALRDAEPEIQAAADAGARVAADAIAARLR